MTRPFSPLRGPVNILPIALVTVLFAIAVNSMSQTADAALEMSFRGTMEAQPGVESYFDVILTNTGTASEYIAAFDYELTMSGGVFTGADTSPDDYIFKGTGLVDLDPILTLNINPLPDGIVLNSDIELLDFAGVELQAGATASVGRIYYELPATMPVGSVAELTVTFGPTISDPLGDAITTTVAYTASGHEAITAVADVPEPTSLVVFGGSLLGLGVAGRRQRKMRRRAT